MDTNRWPTGIYYLSYLLVKMVAMEYTVDAQNRKRILLMPYSQGFEPAFLTFGVNIDMAEFKQHYDNLTHSQKEIFGRVTDRMLASSISRYQVRHNLRPTEFLPMAYFLTQEIPSIEVFYLFSCIDTLAQGSYLAFPDWLNKLSEKEGEMSLDIPKVISLYNDYEADYGVGSNLKKVFFERIPLSLRLWLKDNIRIKKIGDETLPDDLENDPDMVMNHLYHHFYKKRRNPFAHRGASDHIFLNDDITLREGWTAITSLFSYNDKPMGFFSQRLKGDDWMVYLRKGLDEATILRLIIYSLVMSNLNFKVEEQTIADYFNALNRQGLIFAFIEEMRKNSTQIGLWKSVDVDKILVLEERQFNVDGLASLDKDWAERVYARFSNADDTFQLISRIAELYIQAVSTFNHELEDIRRQIIDNTNDIGEQNLIFAAFLDTCMKADYFEMISNLPSLPRINEIEQLASYPCLLHYSM